MDREFWFAEDVWKNVVVRYRSSRQVYSGRSRYARVDIVDTFEYGRMLFLDGIAQSAERDEFIYHESLVHPAMLSHPFPRSVCVIGGAEGATIREVCRYPQVERLVMVDIDEELVSLSRKYLVNWSSGAFDDPRVELHFGDGRRYLQQTDETFDVILVDLDDPVEGGPAIFLFTREFYQLIYHRLGAHGTACFQGESLHPTRVALHAAMVNTLRGVFPHVVGFPYLSFSFHETHAHILVAKGEAPGNLDLAQRLQDLDLNLRYLSPSLIQGLLRVPAYVEQAYSQYRTPITDKDPFPYTF